MNHRVVFVLATLSMTLGSAAHADMFKISGGETIKHPTKRGQPLPAEVGGIRMEFCGPLVGPSKTRPGTASLIWAFSLSVPRSDEYSSVRVEDVSGEVAQPLLSSDASALKFLELPDGAKVLQLQAAPVVVGLESTAWIYEKGKTVRVFRIVLEKASGESATLYQPSMFNDQQKKTLRMTAERAAAPDED